MKFFSLGSNSKPIDKYYINLTNGLECLTEWKSLRFDFVRWQSSLLEQKHFKRFIQEVDNNILMHLALGRRCCIFDFTSRKMKGNASRACWQGVPWIIYCLNRAWFKREPTFDYGMHICFKEKYRELDRPTKKRLKYYRKWLKTDEVDLGYICEATTHDSDLEYYQKLVRKYL